jgi:uncharacterized membrane protein YeaQ/YmgE (transglycosylase-associated protein family)
MKAGGYGRRLDILLALVGSVVWSGIARLLEIPSDPGLVAVTLVAAVGATSLIVAQRKIWPIIADARGRRSFSWCRVGLEGNPDRR